ncbi:hypothetical protein ACQPYE_17195 [Actinosynnema sp. CA-299493]
MTFAAVEPLPPSITALVHRHRTAVRHVLAGVDDRLLVIAGPGPVREAGEALDYAEQLALASAAYSGQLVVVLHAQADRAEAHVARRLLVGVLHLGLATAVAWGAPAIAARSADLVTYVLARTQVDPVHRRSATRLPVPVGWESVPEHLGDTVEAILESEPPVGLFPESRQMRRTAHLVLRNGAHRPDHDPVATATALDRLGAAGLPDRLVIASGRAELARQQRVAASVARQVSEGQPGVCGIVIDSSLSGGGRREAAHDGSCAGRPCLSLPDTVSLLDTLAIAVERRRLRGW